MPTNSARRTKQTVRKEINTMAKRLRLVVKTKKGLQMLADACNPDQETDDRPVETSRPSQEEREYYFWYCIE